MKKFKFIVEDIKEDSRRFLSTGNAFVKRSSDIQKNLES